MRNILRKQVTITNHAFDFAFPGQLHNTSLQRVEITHSYAGKPSAAMYFVLSIQTFLVATCFARDQLFSMPPRFLKVTVTPLAPLQLNPDPAGICSGEQP